MARKAAWLASPKSNKSWSGTVTLGFLVIDGASLSRFLLLAFSLFAFEGSELSLCAPHVRVN
jgi:hypothetical protein